VRKLSRTTEKSCWNTRKSSHDSKKVSFSGDRVEDRKFLILFLSTVRETLKELTKQFDKSENDLKALQSVGQIVGEVLKQLTEDKCKAKRI
jgi:ATP-dependent 26S proteasome regulatory subunit